jgi:hypothetical protein
VSSEEDRERRARQLARIEEIERARGEVPRKVRPNRDGVHTALIKGIEEQVAEGIEARWARLRGTNIFDLSPEDRAAVAAYETSHLRHELREYMTTLAEQVILPQFEILKGLADSTAWDKLTKKLNDATRNFSVEKSKMEGMTKTIAALRIIFGVRTWMSPSWVTGVLTRYSTIVEKKSETGGKSEKVEKPLSEKQRAIVEEAWMWNMALAGGSGDGRVVGPQDVVDMLLRVKGIVTTVDDVETRQELLAKGERAEPIWLALDIGRISYAQTRHILANVNSAASTVDEEVGIYEDMIHETEAHFF